MFIHRKNNNDLQSFIKLSNQLGYDIDEKYVISYIANELKSENEIVLVAEIDEKIVGWINCKINKLIYHQEYLDILGIIVDENYRNQGIGSQLLLESEKWAISKEISLSIIRSNINRSNAHLFYESKGYDKIKSSYIFGKELTYST